MAKSVTGPDETENSSTYVRCHNVPARADRAIQELLINARRMRGLTQTDAAHQIGISQTLVSKLERGPHPGMRIDELFRVLAFYQIEPNTIAEILGYTKGTARSIGDLRIQALVAQLVAMPDEDSDTILTALEWMIRGRGK